MLNSWYPFNNLFILVEHPSKTLNVLPITSTFPGEIISHHTASSAICPLVKITVDIFFFFFMRSKGYASVKQMHCVWSCPCGFGHHCSLCWVLWLKICAPFCPNQTFLYLGVSGTHTLFILFETLLLHHQDPDLEFFLLPQGFIRSLSIHLLLVILNTTQYGWFSIIKSDWNYMGFLLFFLLLSFRVPTTVPLVFRTLQDFPAGILSATF